MNRLKLLSLVAGLAVGNLVGCSRPSTKSPKHQMAFAPGRELTDGHEETGPGTTESKPSAGIKWNKGSGRPSKPLRKAVKGAVVPQGVSEDREKKLQAENESQPH
jgi:hypothetical protein